MQILVSSMTIRAIPFPQLSVSVIPSGLLFPGFQTLSSASCRLVLQHHYDHHHHHNHNNPTYAVTIHKPKNTQNSKTYILGYSSLLCGTSELEQKTEIYHSSRPIFKKCHLLYYKFIIKQTDD